MLPWKPCRTFNMYAIHSLESSKFLPLTLTQVLHFGAGFYSFTLLFVKCAILLQWLRIFAPNGSRGTFFVGRFDSMLRVNIANTPAIRSQWACHIVLWSCILFYVSTLVAGSLICVPFERIWDKTVPGVCYNGRPLNTALGTFNLISDIMILILPQRVIWRLNMSRKRRIGVAMVFAIGLL